MIRSITDFVEAIRHAGPMRTRDAARLMSHMQEHPDLLATLLACDIDAAPTKLILGVTGPPGVGKSTFIDSLVRLWRDRRPDEPVGVIAIDPSSPHHGGALLGDRVRMMAHSIDPHVFIRSLAARGQVGGLTRGVRGVLQVMHLLECSLVIIETVGVGQSEIDIASLADLTLIVLAPGCGDDVQLLKSGLLEVVDGFVVNQADRPDAAAYRTRLLESLELRRAGQTNAADETGSPEDAVHLLSALHGEGVEACLDWLETTIDRHGDAWKTSRVGRDIADLRESVLQRLRDQATTALTEDDDLRLHLQGALTGAGDLDEIFESLLQRLALGVETTDKVETPPHSA